MHRSGCDPQGPSAREVAPASGSDKRWWGEATDEPAREDARPAEKCKRTTPGVLPARGGNVFECRLDAVAADVRRRISLPTNCSASSPRRLQGRRAMDAAQLARQ